MNWFKREGKERAQSQIQFAGHFEAVGPNPATSSEMNSFKCTLDPDKPEKPFRTTTYRVITPTAGFFRHESELSSLKMGTFVVVPQG